MSAGRAGHRAHRADGDIVRIGHQSITVLVRGFQYGPGGAEKVILVKRIGSSF